MRTEPSLPLRRRIALAGLLALGVAGCAEGESALSRGDRFWADSNYTSALAEYRLAMREDPTDSVLLRVAHAYLETDQFERGREVYDQLLTRSSLYVDQAAFDYVTVARRAWDRADRYGLAAAVEAVLELRPGMPVNEFALPLARYYANTADDTRALDFYERALANAEPDSTATILFEIAELQENRGNCEEAITFFRAFRQRERSGERVDRARWLIGDCSLKLGRAARLDDRLEVALDHVDTVLDLGVPKNLQDDAWYERGEIMLSLGRRDDALFAYVRVLELNPTATGQLVDRARRRINQLRFGRGF